MVFAVQLLRSIGFLLMGLLQVGGASWIEIAHVLACDCCVEVTAGGDCCSSAEEPIQHHHHGR